MTPSPRVIRACAMFGLEAREASRLARPRGVEEAAARVDGMLCAGEVALVTGPSGGGKSTLLRALARRCAHPVWVEDVAARAGRRADRAVIDLFRSPLTLALRHMAGAGLADATVLALRARELSQGQRARLSLALAMERAARARHGAGPPTLIVDEFASSLDRATARSLSRTLSRWCSRSRVRAVCATAHGDVLAWMRPAVLVVQPLLGGASVARSPWADPPHMRSGRREEEA